MQSCMKNCMAYLLAVKISSTPCICLKTLRDTQHSTIAGVLFMNDRLSTIRDYQHAVTLQEICRSSCTIAVQVNLDTKFPHCQSGSSPFNMEHIAEKPVLLQVQLMTQHLNSKSFLVSKNYQPM